MRRALIASVAAALLLAACGQHAGVRAEPRLVRRFGDVGPRVTPPEAVDPVSGDGGNGRAVAVAPPEERSDFVTWPQWATMLLPRIAAPVCLNNVVSVVAWAAQEGTEAAWNPLATTYDMSGSTAFNSHGVRNYSSLDEGLEATVLTIQQGWSAHGYGAIVEALQRCAPAMETARAIRASNWCAGCAEGRYVTGVVRVIRAALRGGG